MVKRKKMKPRRDARARGTEADEETLEDSEEETSEDREELAPGRPEREARLDEDDEPKRAASPAAVSKAPASKPASKASKAPASKVRAPEPEARPTGPSATHPTRVSHSGGLIFMAVVFGLMVLAIVVQLILG